MADGIPIELEEMMKEMSEMWDTYHENIWEIPVMESDKLFISLVKLKVHLRNYLKRRYNITVEGGI